MMMPLRFWMAHDTAEIMALMSDFLPPGKRLACFYAHMLSLPAPATCTCTAVASGGSHCNANNKLREFETNQGLELDKRSSARLRDAAGCVMEVLDTVCLYSGPHARLSVTPHARARTRCDASFATCSKS
jgi:hypothetical protein